MTEEARGILSKSFVDNRVIVETVLNLVDEGRGAGDVTFVGLLICRVGQVSIALRDGATLRTLDDTRCVLSGKKVVAPGAKCAIVLEVVDLEQVRATLGDPGQVLGAPGRR